MYAMVAVVVAVVLCVGGSPAPPAVDQGWELGVDSERTNSS